MTLFEFTFGLTAVILGLALTQVALNVQRLLVAGSQVRWALEPVLLLALVSLLLINLWLSGWRDHEVRVLTFAQVLLQVLAVLLPAMTAATILPESVPQEGRLDLFEHYDRTRRFTCGAMALGIAFGPLQGIAVDYARSRDPILLAFFALFLAGFAIWVALMWVRSRWINVAALTLMLVSGLPLMLATRLTD